MRVSVIMPVYNKRAFVGRALDSILNQTFKDFELIVVDDGSSDGSSELVESYKDPRIVMIRQDNAGPGAARNRGLAQARGELTAFLDADDEWLPNYLSESIAHLECADPSTALVCSGYFEFPSGLSTESLWRKRGVRNQELRIDRSISAQRVVYLLAYISCWSTLAKTEVLRRWGGFYSKDRCKYAEDAYLWLKILINERVRFNLHPLVKFHREASALSNIQTAARPIEPFLLYPDEIRQSCPLELRMLLEQVLAIRALKTACMLGVWGKQDEARELMRSFDTAGLWYVPYYLPALLLTTPPGAVLGRLYREVCLGRGAPKYILARGGISEGAAKFQAKRVEG